MSKSNRDKSEFWKKAYYKELARNNEDMSIKGFLEWFLAVCLVFATGFMSAVFMLKG